MITPVTPEPGLVIAGRYTLTSPLARGGMGSVWIARHGDLEIDVTVKFMAPALVASPEARSRFEREAKVAARIRSQHVVQVLDYGLENGAPFIVMELLEGESLSARLKREGRLTPEVTARLLVQICKALSTAHEQGLVHRDLKPGNIFLARKDQDEVVKVLDFGIAKAMSIGDAQADTQSGVLLGSSHYMSPEQIRSSRTVDHRSDLWSIGVLVFRLLTGRLPFPGAELGDVLVSVCVDPIPPPSSIAPELPPAIDRFFERALARDPGQRFQSAAELAEAFCAAVAVAAAAPRPPQWAKTIPLHQLTQAAAPQAAEATMGSIRAVQTLVPQVQSGRPAGRLWWPVFVVAALLGIAGILGVMLRGAATSSSAAIRVEAPSAAPPQTPSQAPSQEPAPSLASTSAADASALVDAPKAAPTTTVRPRAPASPPQRPVGPKVSGPLETKL